MILIKEKMVTLRTESSTNLRTHQLVTCDGKMTYAHYRP